MTAAHEILTMRGWRISDVTYRGNEQITWWRKAGREFPQHFALWLERTGAVSLIGHSEAEIGRQAIRKSVSSRKACEAGN